MNSTPGQANTDSYVDVVYADAFFASSVKNAAWPGTSPAKEAALIEATRIIDNQFVWNGFIASNTQSLRWPRTQAYDSDGRLIDSAIIPKTLKDAVCSMAYFLLENGGVTQAESNLKGIKIGPIDLKFDDNQTVIGIPRFVANSLKALGSFQGVSQNSAYNVNVMRS